MPTYKRVFKNYKKSSILGKRARSRSRSRSTYRSKFPRKTYKKASIGAEVGRALGSMVGLPNTGSTLGNMAQRGIKSVFGSGDYYVSNSLLTPGNTPPQFANSGRTVRIQHREYITDINSSINFARNRYDINPGEMKTFPWLSSVAGNFECYRLKGMLFEFKSTSASALNSTNTALGTVIMATSYNAANPDFINKQQMENYEFAQSCKPCESVLHYIECANKSKPLDELYIRVGDVPTGQSAQLYDLAYFTIATVGMQQANVNIGELWVTYDIELLKPKLSQGGAVNADGLHSHWKLSPTSDTNVFANALHVSGSRDLCSLGNSESGGANAIYLNFQPLGSRFLVMFHVKGTGSTDISVLTPGLLDLKLIKAWTNQSDETAVAGSSTGWVQCFLVEVTSSTGIQRMQWSVSAGQTNLPENPTGGDVWVIHMPGNAF